MAKETKHSIWMHKWYLRNKESVRRRNKLWAEKHPEKVRAYTLKYDKAHRKERVEAAQRHQALHPWVTHLTSCRARCYNHRVVNYKYYGGKGIKCSLTLSDIKYLWDRDNAYLLNRPSIDRLDSQGHYELGNCRFIEVAENSRRRWEGGTNTASESKRSVQADV